MSNYYLCDTCKVYHHECVCCGQFRCKHSPRKLVMTDDQTPHEVCPHWKPKGGGMSELKPCRACGATRGLYVLYHEHDMEWYVFCDICKTSVHNEYNDTEAEAIEAWNRRANDAD